MSFKRILAIAVTLFVFASTIRPVVAQTSKGIIAGIVRDKTGAVIPGAKVTVTSQETSETRSAGADERGAFRMDAVNSGHYTVRVTAGGFETAVTRDLSVASSIVTTF